ncbi:hypothetical protein [Pontibacter sp. G13]|uniref:hypothetical protein n=1 Tax=Pontibacter sp. G13 TaxID=3074898 RepID=UPI00288B0130|nr:hypothetical protein [Pontibacter sp. G13]WNJ21250.1 hypothetical protein RJD25_12345 [Pontibacter sp. G13]
MKKVFLMAVCAAGLAVSVSSCEKCQTCETVVVTTDMDGNVISENSVDNGELCGDAIELLEGTAGTIDQGFLKTTTTVNCE